MAFFRSIVRLGIIGKERLQYWNLLFWTLFNRPKLFPQAVTLAIYGYHFRLVYERHVQKDRLASLRATTARLRRYAAGKASEAISNVKNEIASARRPVRREASGARQAKDAPRNDEPLMTCQ